MCMLQRGYAVASATLNTFGNNCAETARGRDDDDGQGALHRGVRRPASSRSAGADPAAPISSTRSPTTIPGLLDGIMPAAVFRTLPSARCPFITDARLLKNYFDKLRTVPFTDEQKRRSPASAISRR